MHKDLELIQKLTEGFGVSGFENEIAALIKEELYDYSFTFESDNLGSLIVHYQSDPKLPHIAFYAHMDEVGFIVSRIEDNGFLRFNSLGGFNKKIMLSERVLIRTYNGDVVNGLIPSDIIEKDFKTFENFYIDIGATSKQEVLDLGINVGSPIIFDSKFIYLRNDLFMCKALDDRICAYSLIMALKQMATESINANVTAVFTVQEEVGCRGARTSSFMVNQDVAFALDVTDSFDIYDGNPLSDCKVNNGIALSVIDGGTIAHRGLLNYLVSLFNKNKLLYTFDPMAVGGTDSSQVHIIKNGVINLTISLPVRYMHSPNTIGSLKDASIMTDAVLMIVEDLDNAKLLKIKESKFERFK